MQAGGPGRKEQLDRHSTLLSLYSLESTYMCMRSELAVLELPAAWKPLLGSLPVGFTCKECPQLMCREHEEGILRLGLPVCDGVCYHSRLCSQALFHMSIIVLYVFTDGLFFKHSCVIFIFVCCFYDA